MGQNSSYFGTLSSCLLVTDVVLKMSYRYSVSHVSRVQTSLSCAPALTVGNQPLERNVDIVFLLATDAVTADLTVLDRVQIHLLYQTVFIKGS